MDGRRRPASFSRPGPGAFIPGGSSGHGTRPTSASKRLGPGPDGHGAGHGWGKERGLTRQASAPSLVHHSNSNTSFDSFSRTSQHGGGYDAFSRSPGLRRSSSATTMGSRAAPGLRSGGFASAPRRRSYENPSAYATPERDWEFGGRGSGGFQHRGDALQLESRLTERLREHSMFTTEGATRRNAGGPRSRMGTSMYGRPDRPERSFHEESGYAQSSFNNSHSRFDARSSNMDPSRGWPGNDRRAHLHGPPQGPTASPNEYGSRSAQRRQLGQDSFMGGSNAATPPQLRSDFSAGGLSDIGGGMPETRLKIYSDLFEEVIERDRVFGSLLRKIKTAYDMLLLRPPAVPPFPPSMTHQGHSVDADPHMWPGQDVRGPGSLHSNEPTTRAEGSQAYEVQKENRVLKDLVERLHLELEEAVRREHRWKQKVTKLKAKAETPDSRHSQSKFAEVPDYNKHAEAGPDYYSQKLVDDWIVAHGKHPGAADIEAILRSANAAEAAKMASHGQPRFHPSRREPTLGDGNSDGQEGLLNQGGLLSLSSISPTASVPPLPESFAVESARSTDSGNLPQRPARRAVTKPDHVPRLDFSKLKSESEDEEDEEGEMMEHEGHDGQHGYMDSPKYSDQDVDIEAHEKAYAAYAARAKEGELPPGPLLHDDSDAGSDEDACWPSFERCRLNDLGHICHPSEASLARPQNPIGYDEAYDDDDDDHLHEGLSRRSA